MSLPGDDERLHLLIIGTGGRSYREYLLRSISSRYRIHLLTGAAPTWEADYITGHTVLANFADTVDADEMITAAKQVAARAPLHGVLAWDEARILQAAKVAAALGLLGGDPDAIMRCRDKHLTRQALAAAGISQPSFALVAGVEEALAAAEEIGYPVVLKPRALAASLGVVRVDGPSAMAAQFAFTSDTTVPGAWHYDSDVLVEEFLAGPEISIDSAVHAGRPHILCLARKEIGWPPYFEEVGHVVDAADPLLADPAVQQIIVATHAALGFTDGVTHTELKLMPSGPAVIEVNGRLGGDLIPYLGLRASGIDPGLAAADVACGRAPLVMAQHGLVGAVRFFYPTAADTTIGTIGFAEQARTPATDRLVTLAAPGDTVSPPPKGNFLDRVAVATAVAETEQQCRDALDAAHAGFILQPAAAAAARVSNES